ncbi:MAG: hypothetical protein H6R05_1030 [Burkholderiaceae bacterium]|nr:hypothetical protein [Burkholderiaceae bacterium]
MKSAQASFKATLLFGVCASLLACSTPEIQKMSAMDAVKFGNTQFFEMPNYRFDMNAKLLDLRVTDKGNNPKTASFNKYMNYFGKHLTFGSSGVIDTENQQFQMIPSYGFQSKNANVSIRFPIVYDHKQKLLFADLSALSGLLTDVENEGKYSKFSTANLPIPADADVKLVQLMRKYATVFYDDLKPEAFIDLPLTDADRAQKAVRKIQVTLKPQEALEKFPMMLQDIAGVFTQEGQKPLTPLPDTAIAEMKSELSKMLGENSKDIYSIAFNRAGQIVSMNANSTYEMDLSKIGKNDASIEETDAPAPMMNMRFNVNMTVSDIGKAKLIDPPTTENTVDGKENFKGGLFGSLLGEKNDEGDEGLASNEVTADATEVDAATAVSAAAEDATKAVSKPVHKKARRK